MLDVGASNDKLKDHIHSQYLGITIGKMVDKYPDLLAIDAHFMHKSNLPKPDIIFCSHMLEHTISPLLCLHSMRQLLKPEGDIIIGVPEAPGFLSKGHVYVMCEKGWMLLFGHCGFEVVNHYHHRNCGCYHLRLGEQTWKKLS